MLPPLGRVPVGLASLLAGMILTCQFAVTPARASEDLRAALDGFSGEWDGELQVFALDGFLLKSFPARRYYAWNGSEQVVITRFFDGASDYEVRARQTVDLGRLQASVIRPGQPAETYTGTVEAGTVVWTNAAQNRRDYTERLVTTDGVTRLQTTGSEIMRVRGVSGVVRVTGAFVRVSRPEPISAVAAGDPAPVRDVWQKQAEKLEQQRAALESRLEEADARAARVPELEESVATLSQTLVEARAAERRQAEDQSAMARRAAELEARAVAAEAAAQKRETALGEQIDVERAARELVEKEAAQLRFRAEALEADAARAVAEAERAAATSSKDHESERIALHEQVAALMHEVEAGKAALARLQADRDALARAHRDGQLRLDGAESAARDALARLSAAETQLEHARQQEQNAGAVRGEAMAAALEESRRALAAAQAETAAVRDELGELRADRDTFASRLAGANETVEAARAALFTAESTAAATDQLRAELDAQRVLVTQREQELSRVQEKLAVLTSERDGHVARIAELERWLQTAPPATAANARDELQPELNRLLRQVTELESERNAMRDAHALVQSRLEHAQQLRDDTISRFRDVVAQLNAMREDRDRLARANVSLQSELRAARGSQGEPSAVPTAPAAGPSFLERLLGGAETPEGAERETPGPPPARASDQAIEAKIAALQVIGITRTPEEDKVILNGRLYRSGDIIDTALGLVFERIEGDALVFSDSANREFRRQLREAR